MTQENEHPVDTGQLERQCALDIEASANEVRCYKVQKRYNGPRIFIDDIDQHVNRKTVLEISYNFSVCGPTTYILHINGVTTVACRAIHSIRRRREVYEFFTKPIDK